MNGRSVGTDLLGLAALAALGVFVFSAGVYAGAQGSVRGTALVIGTVAVALTAVLSIAYARTLSPRDRVPGRR